MEVRFLSRSASNSSLILIFPGWSADSSLYAHVEREGWDVCVVEGYEDPSFDNAFLKNYSTVFLYAWSLGVAVANDVVDDSCITAAFAINGTQEPVSDSFGIAPEIYFGTHDNLSERNLLKFQRRMFLSGSSFDEWRERMGNHPSIELLKKQLMRISEIKNRDNIHWKRAYISDGDAIIPTLNQQAYWNSREDVEVHLWRGAHFIDLSKIINSTIPNPKKVGERFGKSFSTYDRYASAQRIIARHLAKMISEYDMAEDVKDVVELGVGTALFTKEYLNHINPQKITYVDAAATPRFDLVAEEEYHVADAEKWIKERNGSVDAVLSASTVQWFVNIRSFLKNVAASLKSGGLIAISTFLPGNLHELDSIRRSPILYPTADDWHEWMKDGYCDLRIETEDIELHFDSARELLLHLHNTGVGGSDIAIKEDKSGRGMIPEAYASLRSLTYKPLYITARKK